MKLRWKLAQAAEIRWWKSYLRQKSPKEYLAWKKQYWIDFLEKCAVKVPKDAVCLDAGCGPAGIFIALENQPVKAIDPLLNEYEASLAHFNPKDYPWTVFEQMPLEQLSDDGQYDFIFCLNAINHVADWELCLHNLFKALKPQGTLLLSTDVHRKPWLKPLFRFLPGDILHPQQHSLEDYQKAIEAYEVASIERYLIKQEFIFDYYAFVIHK